jgi:hypothetical protein
MASPQAGPQAEPAQSEPQSATAYVHAKLDVVEEQRFRRTGRRTKIDLLTLPDGDVEPVASLPGWVEVGWVVWHGGPEPRPRADGAAHRSRKARSLAAGSAP